MQRRQVLASAVALLPLAGCLDTDGSGDETTTTTTTEMPTTNDPPTEPKYKGADIEVRDVQCASGDETAATASVEDGRVLIRGTITGNDGCYVAKLHTIVHDEAASELRVVVESVDEAGDEEACIECETAIDYEVSARFEGGHPDTVVVSHRRDGDVSEVASVTLGTATG